MNPASSLGPAIFSGVAAFEHVWLFILAPLAGGLLAALVVPAVAEYEQPARIG